ncbi:MAG TPA: OmpA family protein [Bryobacteraceae bacterium]|nr:OmpA family protein [Bryobacteraceae bacterium]
MRFHRYAALASLVALFSPAVFAQGLNTQASKDDWEEINFEFNSSVLVDGFPSLLRLAELLQKNPGYRVKIEGHADQIGSDRYNERLGLRRANTVRDFLVKYQANANQLTTSSLGERNPKVASREKNARFMNRRVTLTVTDPSGRVIAAGGIDEAIKAMQAQQQAAAAAEKCCADILKRLDRLDEIADMLRKLAGENDALRKELADVRKAQSDLDTFVRGQPKPLTAAETSQIVDTRTAEQIERARMPRYATINMNAGLDSNKDLTFTGRGRLFLPFKEQFAVQFQGEYLYFRDRQEGQLDFGLVNRFATRAQAGIFGSFKNVGFKERARRGIFRDVSLLPPLSIGTAAPVTATFGTGAGGLDPAVPVGNAWLGQASGTLDYIFTRGRVGVFGSKGFLNEGVLNRVALTRSIFNEYYIRTIDQIGVSALVGLMRNVYVEGNLGYLKSVGYADRPGGTARFVFPITDRFAFTLEGGMNETLLTRSNWGRVVAGFQFGNFMAPRNYLEGHNGVQHAVPVDVPRVRYELLSRRVRTGGNEPPVADAGPDQIGVPAGPITLDASGSFDPDGDPITFQWTQIAGPAVALSGANTARATFTAAEGTNYAFRVTVRDDKGAQGIDRVEISTERIELPQIIRFQASPASIRAGQSSTIDWQVVNADTVTITDIGSGLPQSGSRAVTPARTTQYRITARNRAGEVSATTTVVVEEVPRALLTACHVSPTNITAGETATIFWSAQNANTVNITGGIGSVDPSGSRMVSPTETTTYTITAEGAPGTPAATCTVTVTVMERGTAPRIITFTANPMTIIRGDQTTLTWNVENADTVTISPAVGTVSASGTRAVTPADTTTYTLTATNRFGTSSAQATITVNPPPVQPPPAANPTLTACTANPATITTTGGTSTISFTQTNATRVTVTNFTGTVPLSGPITVSPTQTTTYVITATGAPGTTAATCSVTVTVNIPTGPPPVAIIAGPAVIDTIYRQLELDARGSVEASGGGPLTYIWEPLQTGAAVLDQGKPVTRIQIAGGWGDYQIRLTVRNAAGQSASTMVTVRFRSITIF